MGIIDDDSILVNKYINTSYDIVKFVYDNLDRLLAISDSIPSLKGPCVVATLANVALSGLQIIDTVQLVDNDRVIVNNQTNAAENGLYTAHSTAWIRTTDFDSNAEIINGAIVFNIHLNLFHEVVFTAPLDLDTTLITLPIIPASIEDHTLLTNIGTNTHAQIDTHIGIAVTKVGTPVDNQIGVWTGDGTLEGISRLTYIYVGAGTLTHTDANPFYITANSGIVLGANNVSMGQSATPWHPVHQVFEIWPAHVGWTVQGNSIGSFHIGHNYYEDGDEFTPTPKYVRGGTAGQLLFNGGSLLFNRAVSGTTDGAITWLPVFDQQADDWFQYAKMWILPSTATRSGLRIMEGVAPTSPGDGDVWVTAAGAFNVRLNAVTVDLSDHTALSNIGTNTHAQIDTHIGIAVTKVGTPVNNQLAVWTGDGTLEGESALTYTLIGAGALIHTHANPFEIRSATGINISSNHIGLGGFPEAWENTHQSVDISNGSISRVTVGSTIGRFHINHNYYDAGDIFAPAPKYIQSGTAGRIQFNGGDLRFDRAASGTSGSAITWLPVWSNIGDFFSIHGQLGTAASTAAGAGFAIAEGVAPTAPVDGDVWVTAAGAFNARLNGATVDLSDHTALSNIGTNAHSVIDTHLADVSIHTEDALLAHLAGTESFTGAKTFGALTVTGAFTSLGITDTSPLERLQLTNDAKMLLGRSGDTAFSIMRTVTNGLLALYGGTIVNGGNVLLYGSTSASEAGDVILRSGTNTWMWWDESVGDLEILTGIGAKTTALTIDASQNATFTGRITKTGTALIAGDFALSAGWGTTASVGTIVGNDQRCSFIVTSTGTGQAANPTITLTFTDGAWPVAPIAVACRTTGSQITVQPTVTSTSTTTLVLTFQGTPVAAETFGFSVILMG